MVQGAGCRGEGAGCFLSCAKASTDTSVSAIGFETALTFQENSDFSKDDLGFENVL